MGNRIEPPAKSMAISFFIIVPIALSLTFVAFFQISSSLLIRIFISSIVFFVALWILRIISTLILSLIYRIPINNQNDNNLEQNQLVELRNKISNLMLQLDMDKSNQMKIKGDLMLGKLNEEDVIRKLEEELMNSKRQKN